MIAELGDAFEYDRHHGNIAHELAEVDPAAAERVLGMMREKSQRDQWAVRVCYRMAPVDLARARRIAASIESLYMRAHVLGVMAEALAGIDAEQARPLLDQAFAVLQSVVESGERITNADRSAAGVAAFMLSFVEHVEPARVEESLWRAVSFRPPTSLGLDRLDYEDHQLNRDPTLALFVARYDRELAHAQLEPLTARILSDPPKDMRDELRAVFLAAAAIDPHWAAALIERLPVSSSVEWHRGTNMARSDVAAFLLRDEEERWHRANELSLWLWNIDQEDL
ncbi:MAG: hypothetical protein AB1486_21450 [Planctomycetota bacterium]